MAEFPYMPNPARVELFFDHIQKTGVPPKVTIKYLESVGFKSKNDRPLIRILKFIGFLDSSGVPTELWGAYRNKDAAPRIMTGAISKAYSDLFNVYPDAYRKDSEALRNYFSTKTAVAERTLGLIVRTFTALCELADFEAVAADMSAAPSTAPTSVGPSPTALRQPAGMTVNINIQLALPVTEDASIYEKLFAALKKHLLS